jgi:plasmid stabilization system protein ParE
VSDLDFEVSWTEVAIRDLERIIEFLKERDIARAGKVLDALEKAALTLGVLPMRGRIVPELRSWDVSTYRELLVDPYRLIYRTDEERVWVVAVIDGRRDLESVLLERLFDE